MSGHKIYGNRSIRPTYDGVQKNVSNVNSGGRGMGFTNKKIPSSDLTNSPKNMSEFERNAMLLALNTVGLNQVSFFGMDQNQFNNYYQNFSRSRKNINSHDLAYKLLSSLQQKYPVKKEQNINNQVLRNNVNKKNNTTQIEEIDEIVQIKPKRGIVNQFIKEDIIKPDKNVTIDGKNIIFSCENEENSKKKNNIVNQKEQNYFLQTVNIDVNDRISNINGKSCVLLEEFVLDKMK